MIHPSSVNVIAAATALSHTFYPDPCQFTYVLLYCPFPSFWVLLLHIFLPHAPWSSSVERRTTDRPRPTFAACESIQRQRTTVTDTATYTGTQVSWPCRREKARRGGCFLRVVGVIPAWVAGSSSLVFFFFRSLTLALRNRKKKKKKRRIVTKIKSKKKHR